MNFSWKKDPFDSKILLYNTAKIDSIESVDDIQSLIEALKKEGIEYATYRLPSTQIEMAQNLEKLGFLLVDGSINFEADLRSITIGEFENIEEAKESDLERLRDISGSSFSLTRFFNDPIISIDKAQSIYREWITNSLNGYADKVFVYKKEGKVLGYVTVKDRHIQLIAVESSHQGKGIGKKLIWAAVAHLKKRNLDKIFIETQIQNIKAIRAYTKCGFKAVDTFFTFRILLEI